MKPEIRKKGRKLRKFLERNSHSCCDFKGENTQNVSSTTMAYYNVIEYSLVSTLRPSYEGYKVTLRPSYKGRKVSTSLKSGNHGLLICLGGKQNLKALPAGRSA